jgi:hypothetical protein
MLNHSASVQIHNQVNDPDSTLKHAGRHGLSSAGNGFPTVVHITEHIIYAKRFSQRRRFWLLGIQHCGQSGYHRCTPVHSWRLAIFYWWAVPTLRVPYAYSKWPNVGWALPPNGKNIQTPAVGSAHPTSTTAAKYMLNLIVRCAFS